MKLIEILRKTPRKIEVERKPLLLESVIGLSKKELKKKFKENKKAIKNIDSFIEAIKESLKANERIVRVVVEDYTILNKASNKFYLSVSIKENNIEGQDSQSDSCVDIVFKLSNGKDAPVNKMDMYLLALQEENEMDKENSNCIPNKIIATLKDIQVFLRADNKLLKKFLKRIECKKNNSKYKYDEEFIENILNDNKG